MATINQIKKQIETAEKRLNQYEIKIEMYAGRARKNVEKATKILGFDVNESNYESIKKQDFDLYFSISNAIEYLNENKKNAERQRRELSELKQKLDAMVCEFEQKNNSQKPLEIGLRTAMNDFRKVWFEKMNDWYKSHFVYMRKRLGNAEKTYSRAKNALHHFQSNHSWHEYRFVKNYLESVMKSSAKIIMDYANRMGIVEYMELANKKMNEDWENCIKKLVEKCSKFNLNESKIKAHNPEVTEKGFDVILTDGSNRYINARIIWAAEYSVLVAPHTRYIVTEKKTK